VVKEEEQRKEGGEHARDKKNHALFTQRNKVNSTIRTVARRRERVGIVGWRMRKSESNANRVKKMSSIKNQGQ